MEVVDSILKGSGEYNIQDNIMSALAAFYDVWGGESWTYLGLSQIIKIIGKYILLCNHNHITILSLIVYWLKYATNSLIWLAERQPVRRRTDWRMDRATHWHNKQRSDSVKFHRLLFYLFRYTIKLLLTEISVHTGNICSEIQGAWTSLRSVHTPWMSEQIFPRMDLELG